MVTSRGPLQGDPASPFGLHTIVPIYQLYKCMVIINRPITPFMLTDESIDDAASIHTLFSIHYGITHTCRIRDILLVLFLVLTCQISMPTFTIRFYMTYNCG